MEVDLSLTGRLFLCMEGVMILIALIGFIVIAEVINQTLEGDN